MTQTSEPPATVHEQTLPRLPRPAVKKSRWPYPLIWLIPIAALAAAIYFGIRFNRENGPEITIRFDDANGVKPGDTVVKVRGVGVGTVEAVGLTADQNQAAVHVRLHKGAEDLAREGTIFWMNHVDLATGDFSGLSAIVRGPDIEAIPGSGAPCTDFLGRDKRPVLLGDGLRVVLHADRIDKLQIDSPVYYRGVQVGAVQDIRFSEDSTQVNVTLFIWHRYTPLVRSNSRFWAEKGTDVKGGLFTGIQFQLGSLRTLLAGGVTFNTPDQDIGSPAVDGADYVLHEEPKSEWQNWMPRIPLAPDEPATNPVNTVQTPSPEK